VSWLAYRDRNRAFSQASAKISYAVPLLTYDKGNNVHPLTESRSILTINQIWPKTFVPQRPSLNAWNGFVEAQGFDRNQVKKHCIERCGYS